MRLSVITPVLNEVEFIGFSIMACLDQMHEFVYALDSGSNDGTRELLHHIKDKYAHEKLVILETPSFNPRDMKAYNASFNACIAKSTGDFVIFLHPDMWIENPGVIPTLSTDPLAYWVHMRSFVNFETEISKGRTNKWKNIHANRFGLHYSGGYGSVNEDFYHSDITGTTYKTFGTEFSRYPFEVRDSGLRIKHFCEMKGYDRRLEKMKLSIKEQRPQLTDGQVHALAIVHPRVTLRATTEQFGGFEFVPSPDPIPTVFTKYKDEFGPFKKEPATA
jgi:glycosyltransferase involved in cell wall biosynthesis